MPKKNQVAVIGKHQVELTNLEKVLYPDDHVLKAEIIQYYLKIAPTILRHIRGRALSFIRYPDGIDGESFFQKNKPQWSPAWIESVKLGKEKKDYVLASNEAVLVWIANGACIEIHQGHGRQPHFDKPDYFVIDLDPPDGFPFASIIEMAFNFRTHLENFGYTPFVKTTGRKSVHIVVPIEPLYTFDQIGQATKEIAQGFVKKYPDNTTLQIRKDARTEKVLIDIYRNRESQTIIAPYSLRALPRATVSMPLTWEKLEMTKAITDYTIHNVLEMVLSDGDPWESIGAFSCELHTLRKKSVVVSSASNLNTLKKYEQKRSFGKTPEPGAEVSAGKGNAFVLHRHHASRLHYDLRLEQDDVLKSWAVPKGLPPRPGVKRLAVHTEDHPLKYLNFQGSIPKGEYGGGEMWIYSRGRYEITKPKKGGFYFRLQSPNLNGEYRMHDTGNNQWLLEKVENPQIDYLQQVISPMLAESSNKVPTGNDFLYEVKWDGIRVLVAVDDGQINMYTRNGNNLTNLFPELSVSDEAFRISTALFDGEIVCLDAQGRPVFKDVIRRMHQKNEAAIERNRRKYPAVCYLFDCLYLDGLPLIHDPLHRRREWLADSIRENAPYRYSEALDDGKALFEAAKKMGLEGIMAKERNSLYQPGKRSSAWLKIKVRRTTECLIIGYTPGKGDRALLFGALHLAWKENGDYKYLGKVGTGYDDNTMKEILQELKKIRPSKRMVDEKPIDDSQTTWIEPQLYCEVQYASITPNGTLREPVFLRLRPDL